MNEKEYKELMNNRCASLRCTIQSIITTLAFEDGSLREEVEYVMDACSKAIMADNAACEKLGYGIPKPKDEGE